MKINEESISFRMVKDIALMMNFIKAHDNSVSQFVIAKELFNGDNEYVRQLCVKANVLFGGQVIKPTSGSEIYISREGLNYKADAKSYYIKYYLGRPIAKIIIGVIIVILGAIVTSYFGLK